ncbi:hypothetical protein PR001_g8821 [Phytophthora rubi]|uniref:Retroviral polymerase SH3-like domain-containing protein n=1 Tax=Phytophthora rubi TaxID=129364 RepID=A0A6A3MYD5_9STRA|nr:hypothetical protein PR001_g8821 [Phytophthora rubi]
MRIFGCKAYVLTPKEKRLKWDPKRREGIFMGYKERPKAYRVYDIEAGQVLSGLTEQLTHRRASRRISTSAGSMPPKRSARSAKAPSKPRAVGPKTRAAKAKYVSSALKEATETAEEAVRSRGSTAEGERRSRSRSKTPEAASGKEESPQP